MEYFIDTDGQRKPIPDEIVAASEKRELVHEYVNATAADREQLHKLAIEHCTPPAPVEEPALAAAQTVHTEQTDHSE